MAREIVIDFDVRQDDPTFVHKLRNFGEDLHRACDNDGWASILIEEVDGATNQLRVTLFSKRRIRRIVKLIDELLEMHFLASRARLSVCRVG